MVKVPATSSAVPQKSSLPPRNPGGGGRILARVVMEVTSGFGCKPQIIISTTQSGQERVAAQRIKRMSYKSNL
jgi:hypothetical protein